MLDNRVIIDKLPRIIEIDRSSTGQFALQTLNSKTKIEVSTANTAISIMECIIETYYLGDMDKVISDTMDITINNVMSQLSNATILGNNNASSIEPADVSLPMSNEFASLKRRSTKLYDRHKSFGILSDWSIYAFDDQ
jgi:hypothetical protein